MTELTVALWLWASGKHHTGYDYRHVNACVSMVRENLTIPHRIVCFTDQPDGMHCETRALVDISRGVAKRINVASAETQDFRRLWLFSRTAAEEFPGTVLSLDLDIVIVSGIDRLIGKREFKIVEGSRCPYNASMFYLRMGSRTRVWSKLTAQALATSRATGWVGREQRWIAYISPDEATWGESDGVLHSSLAESANGCRVMCCAGKRWKPWDKMFREKFPDLAAIYERHWLAQ